MQGIPPAYSYFGLGGGIGHVHAIQRRSDPLVVTFKYTTTLNGEVTIATDIHPPEIMRRLRQGQAAV